MVKSIFDNLKGIVKAVMAVTYCPIYEPLVLISSPSGKTLLCTPVRAAMKIVKKHNWKYFEYDTKISRMEALKIFITGKRKLQQYRLYLPGCPVKFD